MHTTMTLDGEMFLILAQFCLAPNEEGKMLNTPPTFHPQMSFIRYKKLLIVLSPM
jgi:hypothetical protein